MRISITVPDNFHCHVRQDHMRVWMTKMLIGSGFRGRVLEMPNPIPPLLTGDDAIEYGRIGDALLLQYPEEMRFTQVLTIQITEQTTPAMIRRAVELGIRVAKVYPRYVTTHSEHGVVNYDNIFPALREAEKLGMIVCFHAEHPSYSIIGRLKELNFIPILEKVRRLLPRLKITVEHMSSKAMMEWVLRRDEGYGRPT